MYIAPSNFLLRKLLNVFAIIIVSGCATAVIERDWLKRYGKPEPRDRVVSSSSGTVDFWDDVNPILETRCVACHACYDAPCQLKMTAIEGIERGSSPVMVYKASRLLAANPSRLFEDEDTISQWRQRGFTPVLNEYEQTFELNRRASLLFRSLELKANNPAPVTGTLSDDYTFGLGRNDECPTPATFDRFAAEHPGWGMPYALPGLSEEEQGILYAWIDEGATHTARPPLPDRFNASIERWESFLNQDSPKAQLVSRYLYEHLYLTNLYVPEVSDTTYFRIVRSSTPPGTDVNRIATRRPFDDPGVSRVYYRIVPELETIVDKTHNPYAFGSERLQRYQELFFDTPYEVTQVPGYTKPDTSNPFVTFIELPVRSRYKFLLDDSQSAIMNFIKGSVCRGQVAVNVVHDHFWVFFLDPDSQLIDTVSDLLPTATEELAVANGEASGDDFVPLAHWIEYAKLEKERREKRDIFLTRYFSDYPLDMNLIWDGDGRNPNASLTVFRHFDSATVEQGLVGDVPKTAWVIDYTLFERIHYLLVAGYDVYGTLGHQLISRLHMDFLRMEGESSFINFLPPESRDSVRKDWYRKAPDRVIRYISNPEFDRTVPSAINYQSDDHLAELFAQMRAKVAATLPSRRDLQNINSQTVQSALQRLATFNGANTRWLAELSVVRVETSAGNTELVTVLRNNAHENMVSIFNEKKRTIVEENTVTVVNGMLGSYPNAFYNVTEDDIDEFVEQVMSMESAEDYRLLIDRFGVRRTHPDFWAYSDAVHTVMKQQDPLTFGLLDYNRIENR